MMTNKQHDDLWIAGAEALPAIHQNLRRANAIACFKELYTIGALSGDDYKKALLQMLNLIGYELTDLKKETDA